MVKYAQYVQLPAPENYSRNTKGFKITTKSIAIIEMVNYGNDCNENITDYIHDGDTYGYVARNSRLVVNTKNDKIQRLTSYYLKNNKICAEYLCKDGEVILLKKYDNGELVGSIKKVDKIN